MTYLLRLVACLFLCVSLNSFGALYDRGNGLIYDDVLDITWLQDANYAKTSGYDPDGAMNWYDAQDFVGELAYGDYNNWRLPSAGNATVGYNEITSELAHMFYINLNNPGGYNCPPLLYAPTGYSCESANSGLHNTSFTDATFGGSNESFVNVEVGHYWHSNSWVLSHYDGFLHLYAPLDTDIGVYIWPVHDGDIGASPVPLPAGIYLFLSGLVGLGLMRGRNG